MQHGLVAIEKVIYSIRKIPPAFTRSHPSMNEARECDGNGIVIMLRAAQDAGVVPQDAAAHALQGFRSRFQLQTDPGDPHMRQVCPVALRKFAVLESAQEVSIVGADNRLLLRCERGTHVMWSRTTGPRRRRDREQCT